MVAVDTIYVPAGKSVMPMEQVPDAETFASAATWPAVLHRIMEELSGKPEAMISSGVILKVASVARTLSVPEITADR